MGGDLGKEPAGPEPCAPCGRGPFAAAQVLSLRAPPLSLDTELLIPASCALPAHGQPPEKPGQRPQLDWFGSITIFHIH